MFSPITVRKPPRESSSGSLGGATERIPTSRRCFLVVVRDRSQVLEGQNAVMVKAWEMVSKSMSIEDADLRREERDRHSESEF